MFYDTWPNFIGKLVIANRPGNPFIVHHPIYCMYIIQKRISSVHGDM